MHFNYIKCISIAFIRKVKDFVHFKGLILHLRFFIIIPNLARSFTLKQIVAISRAISRRFSLIQLGSYETRAGAICYCRAEKADLSG